MLSFFLIGIIIIVFIKWQLLPLVLLLIFASYYFTNNRSGKPTWTIVEFLIYSAFFSTLLYFIGWYYVFPVSGSSHIIELNTIIIFISYLFSFISISLVIYINELDIKQNYINNKFALLSILKKAININLSKIIISLNKSTFN